MNNSCTFKKSAMHICGSYQFNLGKQQGDLCDVHYWQTEAEQLRAIAKEQHEALVKVFNATSDTQIHGMPGSPLELMRDAIAKFEAMQNE